ncbi:hypothetical protein VTP01DRAFT_2765 [Rhizomucor pusillus]|uniref:uncharacterized protein n=1 Tax=Rhizomucor pusillus TaxID=4840 RepID=UPI00374231F5
MIRSDSALSVRDARGRQISLLCDTVPTTPSSKATTTAAAGRRRYHCTEPGCNKSFTTSGHLARHNRIHTGEKNYWCLYPGCPSRFSRQDNMMQHYRTHMSPKSRRHQYHNRRQHHQHQHHYVPTPRLHYQAHVYNDHQHPLNQMCYPPSPYYAAAPLSPPVMLPKPEPLEPIVRHRASSVSSTSSTSSSSSAGGFILPPPHSQTGLSQLAHIVSTFC